MMPEPFQTAIRANAISLPPLPYIASRNQALRKRAEVIFALESTGQPPRPELVSYEPGTVFGVPVHFQFTK